jgi:hypothetical protein
MPNAVMPKGAERPQTCPQCARTNPKEALYCHFDGVLLRLGSGSPADGASINFGARAFTNPLVFGPNRSCRNFDELARACHDDPQAALELLKQGYLENFFSSQGRIDLAKAAREAGRSPDRLRALDDFLGKLPTAALRAARLRVEPASVDLGTLRVGEDKRIELTIFNDGMRLLQGTVTSDCPWLRLGDSPGLRQKMLEVSRRFLLPVHVRGLELRAYHLPQTGEVVFHTNGGKVVVRVVVRVPITPFPDGPLAGAKTPRELAAKARTAPKAAAPLIESGAVARWYRVNGWTYPVQGPPATGIGAVQQFFEALGLVRPPLVQINTREVYLQGRPGEELKHAIEVFTLENRPVNAHGASDQPWLQVRRTIPNGRTASVRLAVPVVPYEPGETLRCQVTITANGNQRFVVPVTLAIQSSESEYPLFVEEGADDGYSEAPPAGEGPVVEQLEEVPAPTAPARPAPPPQAPPAAALPRGNETLRLPSRPQARSWQEQAPPPRAAQAPDTMHSPARQARSWQESAPPARPKQAPDTLQMPQSPVRVWQDEPPPPRIEPASEPPAAERHAPAPVPVYARPRRNWRNLVPLFLLALGLLLALARDQSARDDAAAPLFLQLTGPLTPGSELTVTAGIRHCKGNEAIRLDVEGGACDGLQSQVVQAKPETEAKVTWHVRIYPEAHWCRLRVTTTTNLRASRVVAVRGP